MKRFGFGAVTLWLYLGSVASAAVVPGGIFASGANLDRFLVMCDAAGRNDSDNCRDAITANPFAQAKNAKPAASNTDARYSAALNDGPLVSGNSDNLSADLDSMSFVHSTTTPENRRVITPTPLPAVVPEPGSFIPAGICLAIFAITLRRRWDAV